MLSIVNKAKIPMRGFFVVDKLDSEDGLFATKALMKTA